MRGHTGLHSGPAGMIAAGTALQRAGHGRIAGARRKNGRIAGQSKAVASVSGHICHRVDWSAFYSILKHNYIIAGYFFSFLKCVHLKKKILSPLLFLYHVLSKYPPV